MGWGGRPTARIWRRIFRTCTVGCMQEATGHDRRDGLTSRRRMGGFGRWASLGWRTRSFNGPLLRCSTPSTRRIPGLLVWVLARAQSHQALDALSVGIWRKKVNWVLDAD